MRRKSLVVAIAFALVSVACGSAGEESAVDIAISEVVPTTPPVGLPLQPTPTPFGLPPLAIPIEPTPTLAPVPTSTPVPAPTATPAPVATSAPVPEPTAAPEAVPEPTAVPPVAVPADEAVEADPVVEADPAVETDEPVAGDAPAAERVVASVGYVPLGQAAGVSLTLPVARIEMIGFHEAGHPGSQPINAASTGVATITLDTRNRGTDARSAADIVVPSGEVVVAPASGTVIAANNYVLYCEHDDALVYIEPDGLPGWQVRVFHVEGSLPAVGSRVEAGVTRIADSARVLPFESQIDELTSEPSWPHVHVEVVDTSVPDTRPPGPGCP